MPVVDFLTDEEAAAYGRYAGAPSRANLERVFFLDDEDRALVERHRGEHMQLGFGLQLGPLGGGVPGGFRWMFRWWCWISLLSSSGSLMRRR